MKKSVRCERCGRIMPTEEIEASGWKCPQCKHARTPAQWTANVFACGRVVQGTWLAMMAWRREMKLQTEDEA